MYLAVHKCQLQYTLNQSNTVISAACTFMHLAVHKCQLQYILEQSNIVISATCTIHVSSGAQMSATVYIRAI
jgi:hypothetical protein